MGEKRIRQIYEKLLSIHGKQHWWPTTTKEKTFEVILGAILTQNTSWKNVEKAISNLKKENVVSVSGILAIDVKELGELIKPAGYYNQKAERLKIVAGFFEKNKDFGNQNDISKMRKELLCVKGIGPETADSILLYAFGKKSFVIDLYTRRIFSRLGICDFDVSYEELQRIFHESLELEKDKISLFNEFHALIVEHAKQYCSKTPKCDECFLRKNCKENNVNFK